MEGGKGEGKKEDEADRDQEGEGDRRDLSCTDKDDDGDEIGEGRKGIGHEELDQKLFHGRYGQGLHGDDVVSFLLQGQGRGGIDDGEEKEDQKGVDQDEEVREQGLDETEVSGMEDDVDGRDHKIDQERLHGDKGDEGEEAVASAQNQGELLPHQGLEGGLDAHRDHQIVLLRIALGALAIVPFQVEIEQREREKNKAYRHQKEPEEGEAFFQKDRVREEGGRIKIAGD